MAEENTETIKRNYMPKFVKMLIAIPSMYIDGLIVFLVAGLTSLSLGFTNDDAYKYVNPVLLYWLKLSIGSTASGLVALQSFRNNVFADHRKQVESKRQLENG